MSVKNSTNQHTLAGITSWGYGCATVKIVSLYTLQRKIIITVSVFLKSLFQKGLYGVYAAVSYLRSWVDTTLAANGGAVFCS
jgi:secreted trypsin-like serine protease